MRKTALLCMLCLPLAISVLSTSCKKKKNDSPVTERYRLSSYTEVVDTNGVRARTNTYDFKYNKQGKVSTITFTTNDPNPAVSGNVKTFSYADHFVYINTTFTKVLPSFTDTLDLNEGGYIQAIYDTTNSKKRFKYNSRSQVTNFSDTLGHSATFDWDNKGNMHSAMYSDGSTIYYEYDTTKPFMIGDYQQLKYYSLYGMYFMQSKYLTTRVIPSYANPIDISYNRSGTDQIKIVKSSQIDAAGMPYTHTYTLKYETY